MSDIVLATVEGEYEAPGEFKKRRHYWTEATADLNQQGRPLTVDLAQRLNVWAKNGCKGPAPT
jgi:hypothetical protein